MDKPVPTLGSKLRGTSHVEVVTYHKHQKKSKSSNESANAGKSSPENEFDMKKARTEAFKLGMSGFFKYKREKALTALAVELGAKPDKKKSKNYKDLKQLRQVQQQRREKKMKTLEESANLSLLSHYKNKYTKMGQAFKDKERKKKSESDILDSYGRVKRS